MNFWGVIFIVLMILWLLGGGYAVYNGPSPNPIAFGVGTLIPWACVAILGWGQFGGGTAFVRRPGT